ncbi:hypothetical protein PHYBOEH_007593 [Phytophthora boehmeriae]|uniref:Uncharacterized protein n=1 Tax=Phytophthora boehmeriae TaxID=109152 RepID=A0A8T1X1B9_9STRA|nr:hypothetical protein PHYBOEH_007593 [Phytophthora boehmeriae]
MQRDVRVQELGRGELHVRALSRLKRAVERSAFVAIDTEMGGISCQDTPRPSVMDSIDERYAQYRESARQFPLVQFGLSVFTWDQEARVFRVETFQFPLFPVFHEKVLGLGHTNNSGTQTGSNTGATGASACPDRRFLVQAKCLQYIRAHGFDLNAWIDRGIGHLSHFEQQQEPCKSALERSARPEILRKFDPEQPALITDETQAFLDQLTAKLKLRLAAFGCGGRDGVAGRAGMQDNNTRRRGRRGGKKNKKKNNGRNKRRGERERDRLTPPGNTTSGGLIGKEETVEPVGQHPEEDLDTVTKEEDAEEDEAADEEDIEVHEQEANVAEEDVHQGEDEDLDPEDDAVAAMKRFLLSPYLRNILPDAVALDCKVDNADDEDVMRNPWRRRVRIVASRSKRQRQALLLADEQLADDDLRERNLALIGFTAILDTVVAARKPIVGHNMLLDLMQCFEKFHAPLPASCAEFQRELHDWLGVGGIFDTKTLVENAMHSVDSFATHLAHTALENCFEVLSKHPFYGPEIQNAQPSVRVAGESGGGTDSSSSQTPLQAHQAGYDAFMTGFVFLRVCSGLGVTNEAIAALGATPSERAAFRNNNKLENLRNVLFVSHFLPTYVLDLPGPFPQPTPTPSRSRFVRMKLTRTRAPVAFGATPLPNGGGNNSSPTLKTFHIKHCVGWALNLQSATRLVNVYWEGQQCVYVELPSPEAADQLLTVRSQTEECWGSTNDPMPSIGCVDLDRCPASYDYAQAEAKATNSAPSLAVQSPSDEDKSRRKRKSSEMA